MAKPTEDSVTKRYGIVTFPLDAAAAKANLEVYNATVAKIRQADDSRKADVKREEIRDAIAQDSGAAKLAAEVGDALARSLFSSDRNEAFHVHALDVLDEIRNNLRIYVDAAVEQRMANKRAETSPKAIEKMREEMRVLKQVIVRQLGYMLAGLDQLKAQGHDVSWLPTKVGQKTGNVSVKVDEVPGVKGRKVGTGNNGDTTHMSARYVIDGETMPEGSMLSALATQWLSTPEETVTYSKVRALLKGTGQEKARGWSVEINGHTLACVVDGDTEDEEDTETDES